MAHSLRGVNVRCTRCKVNAGKFYMTSAIEVQQVVPVPVTEETTLSA